MTAGERALFGILGVVFAIVLWGVLDALAGFGTGIIPGPIQVFSRGIDLAASGVILSSTAISLMRICAGFAIGAGIGVILGLFMGSIKTLRSLAMPLIELLRPIPPLAWVPLAILWLGIGEGSKIFVIAIASTFPAYVGAQKGAENIDPVLVRAARTLDVKGLKLVLKVYLPSALPLTITGLRLSWSIAFATLVAAELIAAKTGLGYQVLFSSQLGQMDAVFFYIILIGVLSVTTDAFWLLLIAVLKQRGFGVGGRSE